MRVWFVLAVLLASHRGVAHAAEVAATYHGTVVDAETGEPLSGAVVTVVWFRRPVVAMDGPEYFHEARETVADAKGAFALDVSPSRDWNPLTYVKRPPWVVILQPGYAPLTGAWPRGLRDMDSELRQGTSVRLPRLRTKEGLSAFTSLAAFGLTDEVPHAKIPLLMQRINAQRRLAGFQPYLQ